MNSQQNTQQILISKDKNNEQPLTQTVQTFSKFADASCHKHSGVIKTQKTLQRSDEIILQQQQFTNEITEQIPLKFGDVLSLSPKDQFLKFITCDGFVQTKAYIKSLQYDGNGQLFDRCLFRIYPVFSVTNQQALISSYKRKNKTNNKYKRQTTVAKKSEEQKQAELQNNVIQEYKNNLDLYEKIKGTEISFNQDVQFLHLASNKFLVCNYIESDYEKENFKLELQEFSSQNTNFKILNSFSHQIRNNRIININDLVYITSSKTYLGRLPYIHCSEQKQKHEQHVEKQNVYNEIEDKQQASQFLKKWNQQKQYQNLQQSIQTINSYNDIPQESQISILEQQPKYKRKHSVDRNNYLLINNKIPNINILQLEAINGKRKGDANSIYLQIPGIQQINYMQHSHNSNNSDTSGYKNSYSPFSQMKLNEVGFKTVSIGTNNVSYHEKNRIKQEANLSLDQKTKWKIFKFSNFEEDKNLIQYGDIIWLHHIEQANTLILKKIDQQLAVTIENSIQKELFQKYEGNTNGMWVVEKICFYQGGKIHWDDIFFLRNFITGKYLNIEIKEKDNILEGYFNVLDAPQQTSFFQFTQIGFQQENDNFINKDSIFYIKSKFYDVKNKIKQIQIQKNILNQGWIHIKEKQHYEDAFKLYRATMAEIQEANFLVSCYPILSTQIENLKKLQSLTDKNQIVKELIRQDYEEQLKALNQCLLDIDNFCQNKIINISIDDQTLNYGEINQNRQRLLTELYYIDLISELLQNLLTEDELIEVVSIFKIDKKNKFVQKIKQCLKKQKYVKINVQKLEVQLINKSKYDFYNGEDILQEQTGIYKLIHHQKNKMIKQYNQYLKLKYNMAQIAYNLLIQICKDNNENGKYVYTNKLNMFKYQAKYIKEAIDFIISIVGRNEFILNNLTDDINFAERKKRNLRQTRSSSQSRLDTQIQLSTNTNKLDNDFNNLENNILIYIINSVCKFGSFNRNHNFLNFFRAICKFNDNGISVNQEVIFKLIQQKKTIEKSLFIPIQMLIQFQDNQQKEIVLDENLFGKDCPLQSNQQLIYLVEQIKLYSDLSLSRNYLWNDKLEQQFPLEYLISQVFNNRLHDEIRSAFCQLVSTVYVDHEPLNLLILPQMCRIYKSKYIKQIDYEQDVQLSQQNLIAIKKSKEIFKERKGFFEKLVTDCLGYINENIKDINAHYANIKKQYTNRITNIDQPGMDVLSNILTFNIVKLFITLIRFNILSLINQKNLYPEIMTSLVQLFEYDYSNMQLTLNLQQKRNERIKIAQNFAKQNKIFNDIKKGIKKTTMQLIDATQNIGCGLKMVGDYIGITNKKKKEIIEELAEYSENFLQNNSLIGGLITLIQMIKNSENQDAKNQKQLQIETDLKQEICKLLHFLYNMRMDYLILNFLTWFDQIGNQNNLLTLQEEQLQKKVQQILEEQLCTVIPNIYRTGIDDIDDQYKPNEKRFSLFNFFQKKDKVHKNKNKLKNFVNYIKDEDKVFPDLDFLLVGKQSDIHVINQIFLNLIKIQFIQKVSSEILPSLLVSFYLVSDSQLQDALLQLILKLFSQTHYLFNNVQQLEVLFDKNDILPYQVFQLRIYKLKLITEKSEVWLNAIAESIKNESFHNEDLQETNNALNDINSLFFKGSIVNDDKSITPSKFEIDKTRQKIFTFLEGSMPIINLIKDAQNQLVKFLKQSSICELSKMKIFQLLRNLYFVLTHFCINVEANQITLSKYIGFFLDEIAFDFGQLDLVDAIYRNNKFLCESFSDQNFKQIHNNIKEFGRQPRFLQILKVVQNYQNQGSNSNIHLIDNQILIFKLLIPKQITDQQELKNMINCYTEKSTRRKCIQDSI
ncbi:MIR domain protein [Ichthyophthirius multifiliis]|uniref:MIR domain protein n=1 Tax=Ichthyophthirius multifiliis TaxID=5932 RepID=G0QP90_ICHMU|nr:MIR domain protein [Ichthyophthirius multifiliis]EGR32970.1 MIR domain protein [Ichthyophthirius multifiliis]|eukprot:XP_004036956.1 MIR domain protein [Ichthyophthirius multifiliis]